jgi:hypothetical protein
VDENLASKTGLYYRWGIEVFWKTASAYEHSDEPSDSVNAGIFLNSWATVTFSKRLCSMELVCPITVESYITVFHVYFLLVPNIRTTK